jgi:hypothetical protein
MKYVKKNKYYPVITGGTGVNKCIKDLPDKVLLNLVETDVDIDFVVLDDMYEQEAHQQRLVFLRDITTDRELIEALPLNTSIEIVYPRSKHIINSYIKLVKLKINKYNIIDTSIHNRKTLPNYDFCVKHRISERNKPIPYFKSNNVYYSTCNYLYLDTLRMIIFYHDELKDSKYLNFVIYKYVRYISKFIMLYKTIEQNDNVKIRQLYTKMKKLLVTTEKVPENVKISLKYLKKLKELLIVLKQAYKSTTLLDCIQSSTK